MATIIRVKRRRNDDPVNSLVVSCKKQKPNSPEDSKDLTNELKFAGTVSTKDEAISRKIRDAIRKEKIEKEYKQHQVNVSEKSRHLQKETVKNARFKIVSKQRALDLANLDIQNNESDEIKEKSPEKTDKNERDSVSKDRLCVHRDNNSKTASNSEGHLVRKSEVKTPTLQSKKKSCNETSGISAESDTNSSEKEISCVNRSDNDTNLSRSRSVRDDNGVSSTEKVFQLYDVEIEGRPLPTLESLMQESQSATGITCNSVPMVREVVSNAGQEEYVYDLYYTNNSDLHLRLLESSLSLDVLDFNTHQLDNGVDDDDDEVYDDEDDENEESNWRNDYPDEDPQFYENDEVEYFYGDDVDPNSAFDRDDDGLSELMSARFHLEGDNELSSPEEELGYDQIMDPFLRSSSYSNYYRRVQQEMGEMDGTTARDT
ncbi:hypothetical protein FSP39_020095 [Pinctada imbricata]|uniref:Probable RNA polymerase II nuclear localization protein SLC7A6OS n=1 Tax=Pinctada imbricata TaxID=66713 RepID=A0AA89BMB9_PINIB|nr:hypothetical protein FSP39_020095 [Pinctada imbricata]